MTPNLIDIHLGRRLRRRRRIVGYTQLQLATMVGVRFQQVQKYECAANRMCASMLWKLAEALETTPSFFYEGLEELRLPMAANDGVLNTELELEQELQSQVGMEKLH